MIKRCYRQVLILALMGCAIPTVAVQAQVPCNEDTLDVATEKYRLGFFDETIESLKPCRFQQDEQKTRAHRLVALSYYAVDKLDSAKVAIRGLLRVDRTYQADPETQPEFFQYWVDELRPRKWHQKSEYRIGIPVVLGVLSTAAYFIFRTEPVPPVPLLPVPGDLPRPPGGN